MNTKIVKKLLISAVCGWLIAFILGITIGGDLLNAGGMLYRDKEMVQFWIFMSAAPGILGGILSVYVYERLSQINKDN